MASNVKYLSKQLKQQFIEYTGQITESFGKKYVARATVDGLAGLTALTPSIDGEIRPVKMDNDAIVNYQWNATLHNPKIWPDTETSDTIGGWVRITPDDSANAETTTLIDPNTWYDVDWGTPSAQWPELWQYINGGTAKSKIEKDTNKDGEDVHLWWCRRWQSNASAGGFNFGGGWIKIKPLTYYRYIVYFRFKNISASGTDTIGAGRVYLGLYTRNAAGNNTGTLNMQTGSLTGNFYNISHHVAVEYRDKWLVGVGYYRPPRKDLIRQSSPKSIFTTLGNGGIYVYGTGEKISWAYQGELNPDAIKLSMRAYYYYATEDNYYLQFEAPRVEALDGTETPLRKALGLPPVESGISTAKLNSDDPWTLCEMKNNFEFIDSSSFISMSNSGLVSLHMNIKRTAANGGYQNVQIAKFPKHYAPAVTHFFNSKFCRLRDVVEVDIKLYFDTDGGLYIRKIDDVLYYGHTDISPYGKEIERIIIEITFPSAIASGGGAEMWGIQLKRP